MPGAAPAPAWPTVAQRHLDDQCALAAIEKVKDRLN
jgi:hypothetical protein